jgi:hypothetical protein
MVLRSCLGRFDARDLGAVLDHEGPPCPILQAIKCSGVAGSSAQRWGVGAMRGTIPAFQIRSHYEAALIDRGLLRLILRRVRPRAFVILNPCRIAPVDKSRENSCIENNAQLHRRVACQRVRRALSRVASVH